MGSGSDVDPYSVAAARLAADRDDLAGWVAGFLASPGSDNAVLAAQLTDELGWWVGPRRLPISELQRLAGPAGHPVLCPVDDDYWDDRVDAMDKMTEEGWQPPPVIVAYRNGVLVLEDGNHRVESVRRAGSGEAWAVIGFETPGDHDRFLTEWPADR
ncbi:MAG TPA: hypothetical protein VG435_14465 [Acidimicrobiales bacterium]|jgi:hypothetical protein|nr:hypothetical protein [Acidimicrobiales bacterium]